MSEHFESPLWFRVAHAAVVVLVIACACRVAYQMSQGVKPSFIKED